MGDEMARRGCEKQAKKTRVELVKMRLQLLLDMAHKYKCDRLLFTVLFQVPARTQQLESVVYMCAFRNLLSLLPFIASI